MELESRSESVRIIQWVLLGWFSEALSSQRVVCGQMDTHLRVQFPGMILIPEGQVGLSGGRCEEEPGGPLRKQERIGARWACGDQGLSSACSCLGCDGVPLGGNVAEFIRKPENTQWVLRRFRKTLYLQIY